jgi:DNA mismatch endonuclease (patch repair protein)
MGRIKGKDTQPELKVRRLLHRMGFRFRLHRRDLPGAPDIVLPSRKKALFVHGCFWHQHEGCRLAYQPKSNQDFWQRKFARNIERDKVVAEELVQMGWDVQVIWQCETLSEQRLASRINAVLGHA